MSNDCFSSLDRFKSIEDLRKLKVNELKTILKSFGEPSGGKKEDLVLRCFVLVERAKGDSNTCSSGNSERNVTNDPPLPNTTDLTYEVIIREANGLIWKKDLRELPSVSFVQLYDYLVTKTSKYSQLDICTGGYKKLRAFQFFKEGHIKDLQLCSNENFTIVKAEVLASMKAEKYKSVIVFDNTDNSIVRAACKCIAGRGLNGYGRCNHVGGVIFAIEDFSRNELQSNTEPVSCTSRLCGWNVPRNMKTDPKPVDKIVIQKIRYGKKTRAHAKSSDYDPTAPSDRQADGESIKILGEKLSSCLQSSIFLIAHNIKSCTAESECDIAIDSVSEAIPSNSIEIDELLDTREDVPFNDDYNISSKAFKSIIDCYIQAQEITDDEVKRIERETRGQSQNIAWMILKETVLTASNFKKAAKRTKEPDCLLRDIMYINDNNKTKKVIPSLQYGLEHEDDAVDSYVSLHQAADNANLKVTEVGTQISKETPGLGASLDRLVYDPSSKNGTLGGLEVKCPYSKRGQSIEQACSDKKFYMTIENGNPVLKREHAYFYQIQGQMYVCNLPWVDFVVWLGNEAVAVQRVLFDSEWWYKEAMPALLYFYKRAFLPEVFTRRVKRGIQLYRHGGWLKYKQYKKLRPS